MWPGRRRDGDHTDEDAVPIAGCFVAVLYRPAFERPGLEIETSAHRWACCSASTPRTSFSCRYTLLTPSVESVSRVSRSAVAAAMFWLALAKVGCGVPLRLMAMMMALA
jgi:hypothetical protein